MPGISPAPAIVNAIEDATGARIYDIPATPEGVLAALEARCRPDPADHPIGAA